MSVKVSIEIDSPITDEDRVLLGNLGIMAVNVATNGLTPSEDKPAEEVEPAPQPCSATSDEGKVCIALAGHRGRHTFRPIPERLIN